MRLLLVEDSKRLQRSLHEGLKRNGYTVDVCGDGQEGLRLALANRYTTIVLDLMLPGIDGLSLLRRLRDAGGQAHVLILTARDTLDDKLRSFATGADDFLIKPFAFEELLARLAALSRREQANKNPQIVVGDLIVDTAGRRVIRRGHEVILPARDYALLVLLASRAGRVVSRAEIEGHLYDGKDEPTSNAVESAIYALRGRIDSDGEASCIETRRGLGWLLRTEAA